MGGILGGKGKVFSKNPKTGLKDLGMFNVPDAVVKAPADGVGFQFGAGVNVGDGLQAGGKGVRRLSSKKTTFAGLGTKEGKRLAMSGKKSFAKRVKAIRKV